MPSRVTELDLSTRHLLEEAMAADGDLVAARLERGCRCFVITRGVELAAYGWLSVGPEWIGELDLEITPGAGEGYVWNCLTIPAYRRQGLFRALLAGIGAAARGAGLRRLWIGSVAIPAERAVGPSGFRPAMVFESRRIAGLHLVRASGAGDERLVADAVKVLGRRPGWTVARSRTRRH